MNRRYIASLAVAATGTLAVGLLVRGRLLRDEPSTASAPPSEASAFQALSREAQLRRLSSFLSERVDAVATLVEYVPTSSASGLRWRSGNAVVTTQADGPVLTLRAPRSDTTRESLVEASDSLRGEWALIVARGRDGSVISTSGVVGGRMVTRCGDRDVTEYLVGAPVRDEFAGAGLFDLAGRAVGMVIRCGNRLVAIPTSEIVRLMTDPDSIERRMRGRYGFTARPLDETARDYFRADSGLLVMEVRRAGAADRAGWTPGDVIVAINGALVSSDQSLALLDTGTDSHSVALRRGGSTRTTNLSSAAIDSSVANAGSDSGIELARPSPATGIVIGAVRPGSAADVAGMRAGDRLLRVDNIAVTTAVAAQRLLDRMRVANRVTFVVFERDGVQRGVLLRR